MEEAADSYSEDDDDLVIVSGVDIVVEGNSASQPCCEFCNIF